MYVGRHARVLSDRPTFECPHPLGTKDGARLLSPARPAGVAKAQRLVYLFVWLCVL